MTVRLCRELPDGSQHPIKVGPYLVRMLLRTLYVSRLRSHYSLLIINLGSCCYSRCCSLLSRRELGLQRLDKVGRCIAEAMNLCDLLPEFC